MEGSAASLGGALDQAGREVVDPSTSYRARAGATQDAHCDTFGTKMIDGSTGRASGHIGRGHCGLAPNPAYFVGPEGLRRCLTLGARRTVLEH